MNTNIKTVWKQAKQPILVGGAAFVVGSFLGFLVFTPPVTPRSCPSPGLQAHFLQRKIAFEFSAVSDTAEPQHAAAPEVSEQTSSAASSASSVESASASSSSASSEAGPVSAESAAADVAGFPSFSHTVYPVTRTPNWGVMKTSAEWNRSYAKMDRTEFVPLPAYDLAELTIPLETLKKTRDDPETIRILTAKLFYSSRFFGDRTLDSDEFEGKHAGIDLKLPEGMPVGVIAGGRVLETHLGSEGLGNHVIVEHRLGDETFYSIYGHLRSISVSEGDDLAPGDVIGTVGSTGNSTGPHLHLQIDRGEPGKTTHTPYWPDTIPTQAEAGHRTVHPIRFIAEHRRR